ncbi:hypothetical protein IJJ49_00395 [Candidatus Saccharibacteria bacterium]|nr:hypothetical protein [Candidatus Saccharibacteria bacterium]
MDIFAVTPMSQDIELEAGKTYEASILVSNPANATKNFTYQVTVSPYSVTGSDYAADLLTLSNRSEITKWIKIEEPSGTLAPNESKKIKFTISVPETAPSGGQYAALLVSGRGEGQDGDGVTINSVLEIASIVFANVEGETIHEGEIVDNAIPGLVFSTPITVGATLENKGNVHEAAEVFLTVKNSFTGETIYPKGDELNGIREIIMPETTRYLTREVSEVPALGVFEITQEVFYLGEKSIETKTVFDCPLWFVILTIFTIGAIIGTVLAKIKKKRSRLKIA